MRSVRREGNRLTDHFLALRRECHHPLIWIICQIAESSHRAIRTVAAPHLLQQLPCPALHVMSVNGSSVVRHICQTTAAPSLRHVWIYICLLLVLCQDWALDLVSCVVEPFQKKVPVANTVQVQIDLHPMGSEMMVNPLHLFNSLGCGVVVFVGSSN